MHGQLKKVKHTIPKHILPIIIVSQFLCTSLWFAGNAVIKDLVTTYNLGSYSLGYLSSSVQFGFIIGTLVFAFLMLADRFSSSKLFFVSALLAAACNICMIFENHIFLTLLLFRFFTGFFLAGIYPIGIKIASDYYKNGLGKSLGFLVAALVLGTAFPHILNFFNSSFSWKLIFITTSCFSVFGAVLLILFVPDGPFQIREKKVNYKVIFSVFKNKNFKAVALGYFGHMWELYAFWVQVPIMLTSYKMLYPEVKMNVSLWAFIIISSGSFSCILAGYLSEQISTKTTTMIILLLSLICCILSPIFFLIESPIVFIGLLIFWGMVVIPDSPLLSSMVAKNAQSSIKGTAITVVNCIGFLITIFSIQLLTILHNIISFQFIYLFLAIGPLISLYSLYKRKEMNL